MVVSISAEVTSLETTKATSFSIVGYLLASLNLSGFTFCINACREISQTYTSSLHVLG